MQQNIWTIGHSTHTFTTFLELLKSFDIALVADIRSFPGSRRYPHFNKDALAASLAQHKIGYKHFPDLGGRRKPKPDSNNAGWRLAAFRGYADYMETESFKTAITRLEHLGAKSRVAYMCSEAVWWSCHRALISDYLKHRRWKVLHIMGVGKSTEHPYTSPAKILGDKLLYTAG